MAIADANLKPYLEGLTKSYGLTAQRSVICTTGPFTNAAQNMFTITGGPVYGFFTGIVTTIIGGTAMNGTLQETTVAPASTATLSTTVSLASKAAGTSIRFVGATGVLTPVTAGAVIVDPVTVADCWFLLPIGAVTLLATAINTGVITWYLNYIPLSSDSVVAAT